MLACLGLKALSSLRRGRVLELHFLWDCLCSSGSHSAFSRSTYFNEIAMSKTFPKGPGMLPRGRTSPSVGSANSGSLLKRVRRHSTFPILLLGGLPLGNRGCGALELSPGGFLPSWSYKFYNLSWSNYFLIMCPVS